MKRSYFLKKKIADLSKAFGVFLLKVAIRSYKFVFTKRTVLFVTNQKIRSVTVGPVLQFCLFFFFAWVGNLFIQSLYYNEIINAKSEEISSLKSVNNYFEDEFNDVNDKLKKINEYLATVTGNTHMVKAVEPTFKQPKTFKEEDLSKRDKHTFKRIKETNVQLAEVHTVVESRIKKIEGAISITGLNIKKIPHKLPKKESKEEVREISLNGKNRLKGGQGGPFHEMGVLDAALKGSMKENEDDLERNLEKVKFTSEIDYLMVLEKLANVMPFAKPMKNYYVSSGFGGRRDPITGRIASHQGLDFVGVTKEKIISPSTGRVILAGKFSDYGNAVVIDHGFGITTRYGHLSEVKVKEGQVVKRGQVLALQGNTGRSTGPHLHYEVRYKNIPLNPKKFLQAGEALLNDETGVKYVNL
jgi:murein DD-endopeptidase MepM/ murein hydrolase activator NlpD